MENVSLNSEIQTNREDRFFFIYSLILLGVVIAGFSPSLFLRVLFEPEPIPLYLHLHGALLTGWFVWLVVQAKLIRNHNPSLHKKMGRFAAAYGVIVIVGGLMATFNAVGRDLGTGVTFATNMADINPAMGGDLTYLDFVSGVVWGNMASVLTFGVLLAIAVFYRKKPDIHKRLILIATTAILGPALTRIARLDILGGEQGPFIILAILTLLASIVVHDLITLKKAHKASLIAIVFALGVFGLSQRIAGSEFGQEFVRNMA